MTEIYLIRHAQSLGNMTGRFLGQTDLDLSELGFFQAQLLKEYLKTLQIDSIYSSSLKRAYNTIKPYAVETKKDITSEDSFREIYAGEWENMKFDDIEEKYPEDYGNVWLKNIGLGKCPGGESIEDLQKRVYSRIEELCRENEGKTIAVVSHGAAIRSFMCKAYGMELSKMKDIEWVSNSSVTHIIYKDGKFEFDFISYDDFLGDNISSLPKNV